jgi:hypothetical protein
MTLFEIIILCVVAAMFVATIFVFIVCISYIKQLHITNKQVVTLTNVAFECRSFLEKLSKHDTIVKINNINGLEKKIGELLSICKNQTNNITQVRDNLDKALEDIKMRNSLIRDNHKFLDNINVKTGKMKDDIDKIGEIVADINKSNFIKYDKMVEDITYIREKLGEVSVDSEKEVIDIDKKLEEILSWTKRCKSGVEALIEGHNKGIDATRKAFEVINSRNDVADTAIDKNYNDVKSILKDIAKISSVLDSYREKINYITTYIENATKLKTASKTKMAQTKTTKTPIIKK